MIGKLVCFRLRLILWKNCMIRRHHYFLTALEIAVPLALFILLAYLRNKLSFLKSKYIAEPTYSQQLSTRQIYSLFENKYQIYYAPKTEFTSQLIAKVQSKLGVRDEAVKGLNSEFDLISYYETFGQNDTVRAVVFKNVKGQPKRLDYVLKPSGSDQPWNTIDLFSDEPYVPGSGSFSYFETGLLAMQLALDTSYIEITSKQALPVQFTTQEFPYPPHYEDMGMMKMFNVALPAATLLSFLLLFPFVLQRVMDEKITGIKELMKMMGLKSWMLWLGWLLHALTVNIISIFFITLLMKVKLFGGDAPVLHYCSASVFVVFLLLYCITIVTFAFLISSFFSRPTLALIVGIIIWMVSGNFANSPRSKLSTKMFLSILSPNRLLEYGYTEIANYESREIGANWTNLFTSASSSTRDVTLGTTFLLFIISSSLYMIITMYMEVVRPGPYGVAKPAHFPALYIWSKISKSNKVEDAEAAVFEDNAKIEEPPKLKTGIAVKNLYKKFGSHNAVNNLSIDVYEGQITALLGHNGAGKTTTMSIITGMISATSGKVFINNQDTKYHMDKIRSCLGFCPQTNLHFKDLNVTEHLIFFAMLKGSSRKRARKETEELLEKMNLTNKRSSAASALSGGMKRKLSLGMALIGNSKVLILDEPTSGLDPEARREIWDILLTFRGSRIVIITTHFMEEADVLGDRIAIMDHGKLMCYGTSMYLKKEYGSGYNLNLVRDAKAYKVQTSEGSEAQIKAITALVQGRIRSATLHSASGNRVTFLLPHDMKPSFGDLLGAVESKKEELCITNIALSVTTLEEVFLKVDSTLEEAKRENDRPNENPSEFQNITFVTNASTKHKGRKLLKTQFWSLLTKRWLVLKRKWMLFAVAVALAIAAAVLTLHFGEEGSYSETEGRINFDLSNYGKTTVFYGGPGSILRLGDTRQQYKQLVMSHGSTPKEGASVSDMILLAAKDNIAFYKDFLIVAAEFNVSGSGKVLNAMYSNLALHGAPISLNLLTNSVLKTAMGNEYAISTALAPLPELSGAAIITISSVESALMWFLLFPLGLLILTGTFLLFPHMEIATNTKQLQLMCGVRAVFYWLVCYIVDIILYLIAVFMIVIGILVYGAFGSKAFSGGHEIGTLLLILLGYGVSVIPYAYLFTYKKSAGSAFVWYFTTSLFFGVLLVPLSLLLNLKDGHYFVFLIPHVGLTTLLLQFSYKAAWNYSWDKYTPEHKKLLCEQSGGFSNPCCAGDASPACIAHRSYLSAATNKFNYNHLMIMTASSILYFAILLLLESDLAQRLWERILVLIFEGLMFRKKTSAVGEHDREDVFTEMDRISDLLQKEKKDKKASSNVPRNEEELLLVHRLEKRFLLHKAVKGVSFAVKPGECFGLLGVNGAGKTTTFRILTGDLPLITGEARILLPTRERIYLSKQPRKYLQRVGYCPQFDALNEVLTGREMLRLFADLRGISEGAEDEINMWIKILGLEEHADKPCGLYSGGNKRKLSVAIALIGGLSVVMLDEPTSGVDPVSRRKLWDTLSAIQKQEIKPSIILTSHSMEECEALCNKLVFNCFSHDLVESRRSWFLYRYECFISDVCSLVIMKAGQLECYGTIPNIKKKYAQGFTIMLKLRTISKPEPGKSTAGTQVQSAKSVKSKPTAAGQNRGQPSSDNQKPGGARAQVKSAKPLNDSQGQSSSDNQKPGGVRTLVKSAKRMKESQGQSSIDYENSVVVEDSEDVKDLISDIEESYKGFCTLKDKHTGLLHYHINDKSKKWSQMFKEMEQLQQEHPIIEDYNISETTLEEVFLSIARSDV